MSIVAQEINSPVPLSAIYALEDALTQLPQVEVPVRHYFADGLYAREMFIPAGVCLTGAVHKTQHLCVISQGIICVASEDGMKELSAPCTFVSEPGVKRAGFALTDTIFTTFHATRETDLDKLVEELTTSTADELIGGKNNKQAKSNALAKQNAPHLEVVK